MNFLPDMHVMYVVEFFLSKYNVNGDEFKFMSCVIMFLETCDTYVYST